jgi:putative ABC transport system permease protein
MSAIAARLAAAYPDSNAGRTVLVEPLLDRFLPRDDAMLELALLVAVGGVLVIACVNLANFMMARATSRGREIAVRMALGAGRRRIVRQLLTESMMIALIGGWLGFIVGVWAVDIFLANADFAYIWMDYEVRLSLPVFTYGLLLAVATALAFGLAPALTASRVSVHESLKEGTAAATPGKSRSRTRNLLVIGQLATVLPLLVCCGLAVRHIQYLRSTARVGFNPDRLLSMRVDLPMHRYEDGARRAGFFDGIVKEMAALPWIEGASAALSLPVGSGIFVAGPIAIEGRAGGDSSQERVGGYQVVTPEYFSVMGIPLLRGRYFTDQDHADTLRVAIISQRMAERDWPDEDPIGRRFALDEDPSQANWFTVVGIVPDAGCNILGEPPRPTLYLPHRQQPVSELIVVARTSGEPLDTVQALRGIVRQADPGIPVYDIQTLEENINSWLRDDRLLAGFLGLLAALALGLACIGLYGVMSYSVGQRTHEIGVRLAMGATGREISWMVLRSCVKLCSAGILIGLVVAAPVGVLTASFMYGIGGFDPVTLLGVTLLLLSVSVLAGYLPARRAMRVDPMAALRCE